MNLPLEGMARNQAKAVGDPGGFRVSGDPRQDGGMAVLQVFECDRCGEMTEPTRAGYGEMGFVSIDRPDVERAPPGITWPVKLLCKPCVKGFAAWWDAAQR